MEDEAVPSAQILIRRYKVEHLELDQWRPHRASYIKVLACPIEHQGAFPMTTLADIVKDQELAELPSASTIREAARFMVEKAVGSVLVMDNGELLGIFTERDALRIFVATRRNPDLTRLSDVMTTSTETLPPEATVEEAAKRMAEGNFRHLPVVDAGGRVLGVVSQRDLIARK
jgi:CBS domain-containing protein